MNKAIDRFASFIEAAANVVAGLILSFVLQVVLFAAMGIPASFGQTLILTTAFSTLSLARGYVLRRVFNGLLRVNRPAKSDGCHR